MDNSGLSRSGISHSGISRSGQSQSRRRRSSRTRRGSASFQLFKDLEAKDEFQKVKMAGFLRELHNLARQETKEQVRSAIVRTTSKEVGIRRTKTTETGISLRGVDLSELTPAEAQEKIDALHGGDKIQSSSVMLLAQAAFDILADEETVVDLRELKTKPAKVTVVGDLHGSLDCLVNVLKFVDIANLSEDRVVIFDGDFVDRGQHSLEVLSTLLLLKLAYQSNVFLLRGNHEDTMTASTYGFRDEIEDKYGYEKGDEIWYEFGKLFAALPICARSAQAVIMHGGIPFEGFSLETANKLDKDTRCELKTVADPDDDEERLVQGILWSDPSEEDGINENERGAGITFGPDIAKDFLERHDLKYIIRAHEPCEGGTEHLDVGDGREVITVFSTANYPDGEGTNRAAVLHLDEGSGEYETQTFIHREVDGPDADGYKAFLTSFVEDHRSKLERAFRALEDTGGFVSTLEWAEVMAEQLDLPDVSWMELQPDLAPTVNESGIDWNVFLQDFTATKRPQVDSLEQDQILLLNDHKQKLLSIFALLDADGNGVIDKKEFASGISMLNEQISNDSDKLDDVESAFKSMDYDGDGVISIDEFCKALQNSAVLKGLTESLDEAQVETLQENHEMLTMAFKFLDSDKSGTIDRDEFQRGIDLLNKRLPERSKIDDPDELFTLLDLDKSGDIDLNEFNQLFRGL